MPSHLKRYYDLKHLHFITCSCYHRLPMLGDPSRRDLFLTVLEQARQRYRFVVVGYVAMPEHFHVLIGEPEVGDPSVVMKVVKERFTRILHQRESQELRVWQRRFYDFNVWSPEKHIEKLRYIHRNPVRRGLVERPDQWPWSSFRAYAYGEIGTVRLYFQDRPTDVKMTTPVAFGDPRRLESPLIRKKRE